MGGVPFVQRPDGFLASTPVLVHRLAVVAADAGPVGRALTHEVPLTLAVFLRPGYEEAGGEDALPPLERLAEVIIGGGFSTVRAYAIDGPSIRGHRQASRRRRQAMPDP
ncbi:hypothetical protein AB0L40_12255 [Patulibacter sp. NPDC049589]|uniref:hypothetical protein n=1 Tax=Patulibacter sp. NPDC049589 TaxID=3154731 RepID=UPI00344231B5